MTLVAVSVSVASGKGVAERWRKQYCHGGKWTSTVSGNSGDVYEKLCKLGVDPDIKAVADAIGNKSWSYIFCAHCNDYVEKAVSFSNHGEGCDICSDCIFAAKSALTRLMRKSK